MKLFVASVAIVCTLSKISFAEEQFPLKTLKTIDGDNGPCRLGTNVGSSPVDYLLYSSLNAEQCEQKCKLDISCRGFEARIQGNRCEIWKTTPLNTKTKRTTWICKVKTDTECVIWNFDNNEFNLKSILALESPQADLGFTSFGFKTTNNMERNFAAGGRTSDPNVVYNRYAGDAYLARKEKPFTVNQVQLTSAWKESLPVTFTSYDKFDNLIGTHHVTINSSNPTTVKFNTSFRDIYKFKLHKVENCDDYTSSSLVGDIEGSGCHVALDDLRICGQDVYVL
eukprot:Awhi_evm1s269